ncbi:unnamed protein product [Paramecium sonneborni]|uniref:Tetratricopeptide repeat protein n=1 Tax=Paramecium sonneborni TaxID=65129 RepID=A0A8S1QWC5_9CILI|nr:unnamed protein product [Paramecium sonneborni]
MMDKYKYAQSLYRSKNYKHSFITTQLCCRVKVQHIWEQTNLNDESETVKSAGLLCRYDDKGIIKFIKRVVDSADTYTYEQQKWLQNAIQKIYYESDQELSLHEIRFVIKEIQKEHENSNKTKTISCLQLLCQILLCLGRIDEALSIWPSFIGLEPTSLIGYQKQAQLLAKLKNEEQSIDVWNLYLSNNKQEEFTYCQQKSQFLFIQLDRMQEAVQVWNDYILKNPNYLDAYVNKADLLHQMFDIDGALEVYEDYIKKHQNDYKGYRIKADFLVSLNQFDDAIEVWERYLQLFPKDKKAYEKMVMVVNLKYQ